MTHLGLFLSSEEHSARTLVRWAQAGEGAGFDRVLVSDHFHPWLNSQGHSPFVWSLLGGIATTTELTITTGVTCPTVRIHPAIVAHAAATMAELTEGRFRLGVGSGEALNEHILGDAWRPTDTRLEMLEESVEVMRRLWGGGIVNHRGGHYTVDAARIYEQPAEPIPVIISGFGPKAIDLAARVGDGFITVQPDGDALKQYERAGGSGPTLGALKVCWGPEQDAARRLAYDRWRNEGLPGELAQTLPMPAHFDQASTLVTEDMIAASIPSGPDPDPIIKAIQEYVDLGFDEVYVNQIGDDIDGFLAFFDKSVRPGLRL
jgi:G6PDH family F420-dependent oxidoreductase